MAKTVIIGGVAAGATAAARLRRRDEQMEIVLFERGDYISYANCGLPYYIGNVIKSRDALLLVTPEAMKEKYGVDVRTNHEAIKISPEEKTVTVLNKKTGDTFKESYDKLVLATGSSPVKPPIPGIEGRNIYSLWNVPDTDAVKEVLEKKKPKSAVVVGGGFIGLEMAENLAHQGLSVSLVEMQEQVMPPLDEEMARLLQENMVQNGVKLYLGDGVDSFEETENGVKLNLKSGKTLRAGLAIVSIGVRPNSELAKEAGLMLTKKGAVIVDEYLKTSDPDIYAVGDVITVKNFVTEEAAMIPLAGPANKQGRICGDNIAGDRKKYKGTLGTSAVKLFDLTAALTGVNEKILLSMGKVKGVDFESVIINQKSHAGYYPGAVTLTLKLIFNRQGKIFGVQAVGAKGADKRVDTVAAVMGMGGTVFDLEELELAYAPPFSSAKDPVNMLGFTAHNIIDGMVTFLEPKSFEKMQKEEAAEAYMVLDVREEAERMVFQIPGSYHIPLGQLRGRIQELDREKCLIVYCAVGIRAYNAARILSMNGFSNVRVLSGGSTFYRSYHYMDMAKEEEETEREEKGSMMAAEVKEGKPDREMRILDCCGMQCPGPVMRVNEAVKEMKNGERLRITASDPGFPKDMKVWCKTTGNTWLEEKKQEDSYTVTLQKGKGENGTPKKAAAQMPQGKTLIVFDGDFDKVLASFIIANGAASMGRPVTMFFTFWGLNALRKGQKVPVKKSFMDRMFGAMMPRGTKKLKLSRMNMGGMGTKMMKKVMKDKNVNTLEDLMRQAMKNGVKLVACTMSMDVMGIRKEELIDGVEFAGVASYLGDAEQSNVNLFV